jgi:hypothetical protein
MRSIFGRSADYKSAIRQITNLRYEAALGAKHIQEVSLQPFAELTF